MKSIPKILTIAGSDSGGGAGIQADLKTFTRLGTFGMSVITAVTAQNTKGVWDVLALPPSLVESQLRAVVKDIGADAVKIGMLFSAEIISVVAKTLREFNLKNIVVDPVMIAKSGDALLRTDAIEALKTELFPLATVVTPNLPEAAALLARNISTLEDQTASAQALLALGPNAVLVKGGHLSADDSRSDDVLWQRGEPNPQLFHGKRIITPNTHGTGCTLSAAITANLGKGNPLPEAVTRAKTYLSESLENGLAYRLALDGQGHGPVSF